MFADPSGADESSLLIHCNLECIIERPSYDDVSIHLPRRTRDVPIPPPRPTRALDYIQVTYSFLQD